MTCMPPMQHTGSYSSYYKCAHAGYQDAIKRFERLEPADVNLTHTVIKFYCAPEKGQGA